MLRAVAARTRTCVREVDTVARIGGDEIAIILVGAGETEAANVLAKIVAANAAPLMHDDAAMYAAKAAGGNAYRFWLKPQAARESGR